MNALGHGPLGLDLSRARPGACFRLGLCIRGSLLRRRCFPLRHFLFFPCLDASEARGRTRGLPSRDGTKLTTIETDARGALDAPSAIELIAGVVTHGRMDLLRRDRRHCRKDVLMDAELERPAALLKLEERRRKFFAQRCDDGVRIDFHCCCALAPIRSAAFAPATGRPKLARSPAARPAS